MPKMREVLALVRANWLTQTSYRLGTVFSMFSILISVIPLYFISDALQPVMAESIRDEGGQYFGFLVIGMSATLLVTSAVNLLPSSVSSGISRGTLEAMVSTPTPLPVLLIGMIGFGIVWTFIRIVVIVAGGWILGVPVQIGSLLPASVILLLTLLAYLPIGLIASAMVVVFRTAGPLPQGAIYLSILLGGVYYPTNVIPDWIQNLSDWVPLTYALRALRRVILEGAGLHTVIADIGMVLLFVIVLFAIACLTFSLAYQYARRAGTLAQY
jgi:ABC-2 type transport system permease protein